jgi:hypothetical protein
VFSENANESNHVMNELSVAVSHNKPIFPLRISNVKPQGAFEYHFAGTQWCDAYNAFEKELDVFVDAFVSKVNEPTKRQGHTELAPTPKDGLITQMHIAPEEFQKHILEGIAIDSQHYNTDFVGLFDVCLAWYEANQDIYTFVLDAQDKLVGYINAMPVEEDTYNAILRGDFLDNNISPDSIMQFNFPGEFYLYFCSIGVDQAYKKDGRVFRLLFNAFIEKITQWCDDGYVIKGIVCDAITKEGIKLCEIVGCKKFSVSKHDSTLYVLSMLPPELKPTTHPTRQLIEKYKTYYNSQV